jgi:hypothetical protein
MTRRATAVYTITVRVGPENGIHRLRAGLKALRALALRALSVTETLSPPTGARRQQSRQQARQYGDTKMQMKKYAGEHFYKVADVKDGPVHERIAGVREGKFGKPDLIFESGSIISLNPTNVTVLVRAYGDESNDWIANEVELSLGEVEYQGATQETVKVRPITPPTVRSDLIPF